VEHVNTLSQFDKEVAKAFKTDKFYIKRMMGTFNIKESWNQWLGYSRFGPPRKRSNEAKAQGGRQEEPMCMRFFIGKVGGNHGKALMQYKFRETDPHWVPYTSDGISCFSSCAPDTVAGLLKHPGIRAPKQWPESAALRSFLTECPDLDDAEHAEWDEFFKNVPTVEEGYKDDQLFAWTLPELVNTFKEAYMGTTTSGEDLGDLGRPEMPDERVLHPLFTAADAKKEARARASNYNKQQEALKARNECEPAS